MSGGRNYATCPRCGIRRMVKIERTATGLCRDCYDVEPRWPDIQPTIRD